MDRESLREFFETIPVMMHSVDPHGDIEFVNNHWLARLGYSREEVIGKPGDSFLTPASRLKVYHQTYEFELNGKISNLPLQFVTKSGALVDVLMSASRETDAEGNVIRIRTALQDMTEQNAIRIALETSNEELRQFAYVASHDLQEPLRTITSFVEILREDLAGKLTEEDEENLDYVCTAASRLRDLVTGLLDFSRVNSRAKEMVPASLTDIAKKAAHDVVNGWNWIEVGELGTAPIDKEQMHRVFINLFGNSIKYAREGVEPRIRVHAIDNEQEIIVSVQDNGRGIDPAYHEIVLQPFKRLHTQQHIKGTGIGLALVRKIIERHGGTLWIESEGDGKGTTVRFLLPK